MATLQERLARLRRYNRALREGDPRLAEESLDLGTSEETFTEPLSDNAAEAEIEQESIVMRRERPVLAIKSNVTRLEFVDPAESEIWRERLKSAEAVLAQAIPAVGRINLVGSDADWIGTGWLVADDKIVTNRHVADHFAVRKGDDFTFKMGYGRRISADVDFLEEIDNSDELVFRLVRPLHIEDATGPDVAFFKIDVVSGNARIAQPIPLASRIVSEINVATIGYPAYDSRIPEPELMERIYGKIYNKKRLAPGRISRVEALRVLHDCTTLGGNSGSAVIDLETGAAIGLHFSGSFLRTNFAVRADVVKRLLDGLRANRPSRRSEAAPPGSELRPPRAARAAVARGASGSTISIPLTLSVTVDLDLNVAAVRAGRARFPIPAEPEFDDPVEAEEAAPTDYDDRTGYDEKFLGEKNTVPLPEVERNAGDVLDFDAGGKREAVLRYEHFSIVMSRSRRLCLFSACNIDGETSKRNVRGPWKWDPRIPRDYQIMKECYGSPPRFSRGHMTRREDPGWGSKAESRRGADDSMHVTNATPQMQAFNSPIWLALEDYALEHARQDAMRISVFTGPYLARSDPTMYGVKIPLAFWKVIAFIHDETGELCATGYEMSQEPNLQRTEDEFVFGAFTSPQLGIATQVPISGIERRSGLRFGNLAGIDPLGSGNEGRSGEESRAPLLAMEQIRFLA